MMKRESTHLHSTRAFLYSASLATVLEVTGAWRWLATALRRRACILENGEGGRATAARERVACWADRSGHRRQ